MTRIALPAALAAALALAGCNTQVPLDPAITKRVETGAATAADKARVALDKICGNYQIADAAFGIAVAAGYIPARYATAEAAAVALIDRTCANPPNDPVAAYKAALDAYTTALNIRQRFRDPAKV